ncbi:MAG: ATP-dependent DNA ligase [Candidatus Caldarchaeum sp.]
MARLFKELAVLCEELESTNSRNEKISLVAKYFRGFLNSEAEEAKAAAYLLVGITSGIRRIGINIGPSTLFKAVSEKQLSLVDLQPLTVLDVWTAVQKSMKTAGEGSSETRKALLANLFARSDDVERKWLVRILMGEMRHGFNAGLLIESVAQLSQRPVDTVRKADMLLGDLGELVKKALEKTLDSVSLTIFHPIKPMLAEYAYTVEEIISKTRLPVYIEPKIDGVRLQVHKKDDEIRVFTRGLKDITRSVPDVVETGKTSVKGETVILDGEAFSVDDKGRPTPFQETMRRIGREKQTEDILKQLKLVIKFFDIIYVNGEDSWSMPLAYRRRKLETIVEPSAVNPVVVAETAQTIIEKLHEWTSMGHEGLMAKSPNSPYVPGRRGGFWFKMKPAKTLDVVVIAAEWGHGRRQGWLSNYHLAVIDETTGQFVPVGKTFKGLTDAEFKKMTEELLKIKTKEFDWGVTVEPKVVLEIEYNEVQKSPRYSSGYALRFARVKNIRFDKSPSEVDTLETVRKAYDQSIDTRTSS